MGGDVCVQSNLILQRPVTDSQRQVFETLLDTLAGDPQAQLHEGDTAELSYHQSKTTKVGMTYPVIVQELTATHATVGNEESKAARPLTVPRAVVKLPATGTGVLLLAAGRAGATVVAV